MAYITNIRKAVIKSLAQVLEAKDLESARLASMFIQSDAIAREVQKIWLIEGRKAASQTYRKMIGLKSIGEQPKSWVDAITKFLGDWALSKLTEQVNETTRKFVAAQITKASAEGLGMDWLTDQLTGKWSRVRARTIARTETVRARNNGYLAGADALPYVALKVWNSAQDKRTRGSKPKQTADHLHMNLMEAPLDTPFTDPRSQALMMYPGDSSLTAGGGDVINCRCRVTFKGVRDADGRLIMKVGLSGL